jgi:hypothetical protein
LKGIIVENKRFVDELNQLSDTPEMRKIEDDWAFRMSNPVRIDGFVLRCICGACPEAYEVFDAEGNQVGYLRLRRGWFRADYPKANGEIVYESRPKGDGVFDDEERMEELTKAVRALKERRDEIG